MVTRTNLPKIFALSNSEAELLIFILKKIKRNQPFDLGKDDLKRINAMYDRFNTLNYKSRFCGKCKKFHQDSYQRESIDEKGLCQDCDRKYMKYWEEVWKHANTDAP